MTTKQLDGSGSETEYLIDDLVEHIDELKSAPLHQRTGLAVRASESIVIVLQDLDRRILQLEISASDQQDNRHSDLPDVQRAGRGSQNQKR